MDVIIGNIFVGVFAYADDIHVVLAVLLSPTRRGLQKMLKVADNFSKTYGIKFNKTKSELLIYSNRSLKDIEVQNITWRCYYPSQEMHKACWTRGWS